MMNDLDVGEPNRRRFSKEEDEKLRRLIRQYGTHDWATVSNLLSDRTPRQCRHRYRNYLANERQHMGWTREDDQMVIAKFQEFGPKWVRIAALLPGRSGNDVKNRWHKHIVKFYVPPARDSAQAGAVPDVQASLILQCPLAAFDFVEARQEPPQAKGRLSPFLQYVLN
jgi:hypothetical protein